jgi:hypothetical protein
MTAAEVGAMLRPKITGTAVLERVTRTAVLDFVVLFSSTSAVTGSAGLAHYTAACAFLDATALANPGRRTLSINWGAWDRIRAASATARDALHEGGLLSMPAESALDALGRLLDTSDVHAVVAHIDWGRYKPLAEARRRRPLLAQLDGTQRTVTPRQVTSLGGDMLPLAKELAHASTAERPALLLGLVRREVAAVLGTDGSVIADEQDLFAVGMDSLMSVELKRRLEAGLGEMLPPGVTFNHASISALAGYLVSRSGSPRAETDGAPGVAAPDTPSTRPAAITSTAQVHPMSHSQKALWFLYLQAPASTAYHVSRFCVRPMSWWTARPANASPRNKRLRLSCIAWAACRTLPYGKCWLPMRVGHSTLRMAQSCARRFIPAARSIMRCFCRCITSPSTAGRS